MERITIPGSVTQSAINASVLSGAVAASITRWATPAGVGDSMAKVDRAIAELQAVRAGLESANG